MKNTEKDIQYIKGVGPKRAKALEKEGVLVPRDILLNFPRAYVERNASGSIRQLKREMMDPKDKSKVFDSSFSFAAESSIIGTVSKIEEKHLGRNRKMLLVYIHDESLAKAKIIFWNRIVWFRKMYKPGQLIAVSGKPEIDSFSKDVSFTHPEIEIIEKEDAEIYKKGGILPKYRITEAMQKSGLTNRQLRNVVKIVLNKEINGLNEIMPEYLLKEYSLPGIKKAVINLHFPEDREMLERSLFRMKFEELFYFFILINIKKEFNKIKNNAVPVNPKSKKARALYDKLPFKLTKDQVKVLNEIAADIKTERPMNRLLQGDVGSGKTIVALFTMLMFIDEGYQVAFMAPTEILAEQHFNTINKFLEELDVNVVQLVGGQNTKTRRIILEEIASGKADIIVGTHALFQSDIQYSNLALAVIDEQHRFGVAQRAELIDLGNRSFLNKDAAPHILVMTATPIPRTLSMTFYGDLDISVIKTKPKNRKPVKTKVVFESNYDEVFGFIREEVKKGRQVYIVYPLVEKSDKLELKSAVEHYEKIDGEIFPDLSCGLLHGQMFWYEKEEVMQNFLEKEYSILVATTVIEVGIDVPNATIMMIENAERFGLSQLHQLRGRVGRGADQSYCFLMTKDHFKYQIRNKAQREEEKKAAIIRLRTMEDTTDGFKISEVDLRLRGPGDVMGTKQSGLPEFRHADIINDADLIDTVKKKAENILRDDPHLRKYENLVIRKNIQKRTKIKDYFDIA